MSALATILAEIKEKSLIYENKNRKQILVTELDIKKWLDVSGLTLDQLCDCLALYLARRFHHSELDFGFCDYIINQLWGIMAFEIARNPQEIHPKNLPELFWNTYLAFDAGEFYANNDFSKDPIETYTRPQIAKIVETYKTIHPEI